MSLLSIRKCASAAAICSASFHVIGPNGVFVDDDDVRAILDRKGGGGGGGAGRIWLRYEAATPPNLTGSVISPPPGMDPSLP